MNDYRFGILASVIASAHSGKNSRKYTADYFFPSLKKFREEQNRELTIEEQEEGLKAHLMSIMGKKGSK